MPNAYRKTLKDIGGTDVIYPITDVNSIIVDSNNTQADLNTSLQNQITALQEQIASLNTDLARSAVSKTYISNAYCTEEEFNRCDGYKIGKLGYVVYLNLNLSSALPSGTLDVAIGSLDMSLGRGVFLTIPAQNGSGTLLINIGRDGTIKISNQSGQNARLWYRAVVPVI